MLHWLGAEQCRDQKWHFTCDFRNYALPVLPIVAMGKHDDAIKVLQTALEIEPSSSLLWHHLSDAFVTNN